MKIHYLLLTTHKYANRHEYLKKTWLKDVSYQFYSDRSGENTVEVTSNDTYNSNEEKQINILNYVISNIAQYEEYDWFCFCDDDTFVNTKKLQSIVETFDPNIVYGEMLNEQVNSDNHMFQRFPGLQYPSGGAGWMISKQQLKTIPVFDNFKTGYSDVSVGLNLKHLKIESKTHPAFHGQHFDKHPAINIKDQVSFHYVTKESEMRYLYNECSGTVNKLKFLVIQENGEHEKNRMFRECYAFQTALKSFGHECDIWGHWHANFNTPPNFNDYDVIINLENYDKGWVPYDKLAQYNGYKIMWAIDTHTRGIDYFNYVASRSKTNLILEATRDFVITPNRVWFPCCVNDELVKPNGSTKEFNVGFCGHESNRGDYIELLSQQTTFKFKKDIGVIGNDMVDAINSYEVHFNRNYSNDINFRSFETIACGTLLLTNDSPQYNELGFKHMENCLIYKDKQDMLNVIHDYFNLPPLKQVQMSLIGYAMSPRHTYKSRIHHLLKYLKTQI